MLVYSHITVFFITNHYYKDLCKTMTIYELFGKRVKERWLSLNLSQEKLANLADIDRTYLPNIENEKRNASLVVAAKIAKTFKIQLTNLLEDYA